MSQPAGWHKRDKPGPVGWVARWWVNRRRARIRRALEARRYGSPPSQDRTATAAPADPAVQRTWTPSRTGDR